MILHDVWQLSLGFFSEKPVVIQPVEENLSSDGGLLVIRQWDDQRRWTQGFAQQLTDCRSQPRHSMLEMVRSRVFGIIAGSWEQPRWVVLKCEANAQGTNRRAVVTNRPGARVTPQGAYDEYADRGESENRNKELKCELRADRLSDHRYMANCFRMFLHCLAHNLLVTLRNGIAQPVEESLANHWFDPDPLPTEARTGSARRRDFNSIAVKPIRSHAGTLRPGGCD